MLGLWLLVRRDARRRRAQPFGGGAGVAYYAHIGGFAFGLLAVRAFARGRRAIPRRRALA